MGSLPLTDGVRVAFLADSLYEGKSEMKVRIQHDGKGPAGYNTRITDAETGEPLGYVQRVEMDIQANGDPVTAILTIAMPVIDVIADAEIKHVCPCCGREQEQEITTESLYIGRD